MSEKKKLFSEKPGNESRKITARIEETERQIHILRKKQIEVTVAMKIQSLKYKKLLSEGNAAGKILKEVQASLKSYEQAGEKIRSELEVLENRIQAERMKRESSIIRLKALDSELIIKPIIEE